MRDLYLLANWKMWGNQQAIAELLAQLSTDGLPHNLKIALFPPVPYLALVGQSLKDNAMALGAQTVSEFAPGAYTGEVAVEMLKDLGCHYVLVGHSERRSLFAENDAKIASKFWRALKLGLKPVLCIGESLTEWEAGNTFKVLKQQLDAVFQSENQAVKLDCIIAYEPVWAIGTGQVASAAYIGQVHSFIREYLALVAHKHIPVVYGGSLKAHNFEEILAVSDVDGGLVGGASLQAVEFNHMIAIAKLKAENK